MPVRESPCVTSRHTVCIILNRAAAVQRHVMSAVARQEPLQDISRGDGTMAQSTTLPNAQQLAGSWDRIKGELRQRWGQLTEDDLERFKGNVDQLIGYLQEKTGWQRQQIESFLNDSYEKLSGGVQKASEKAREYSGRAAEAIQGQYEQFSQRMGDTSAQAQEMIRNRPTESVVVAFGVGVLSGIFLTFLMRSR
jgi:uncharacterized protein YjbJ (UPF0337 family)